MEHPVRIGIVIGRRAVPTIFSEGDRRRLDSLAEVRWAETEQHPDAAAAARMLQGCTIGVGSWGTAAPSPALLDTCPELKLWIHAAGSVRKLVEAVRGREILLASCAPAIAENVAEYTTGALILGLKGALENARQNREPGELKPRPRRSLSLADATIGVVGASQVGRRVLDRLHLLGAGRLLVFDPFLSAEQAEALHAEKVADLTELFRRSDAVTLHTPDLPSTRKMVGAAQLRAMPDAGVLVNTSRGGCIDEAALIEELRSGRLQAVLDVTDPEPASADSPLRSLPNVMLTSHIAGGASHKIGRQVLDDVRAFLEGRPLTMVVTPEMLDRVA